MIELRWLKHYHNMGPDMSRTTEVLQYRTLKGTDTNFMEDGTMIAEQKWTEWQNVPEVWDE